MQYRKAVPSDLPRIMEIIEQAKAQMQASGSSQWQDGYPAREHIEADTACGRGIVACDAEHVAAYAAVVFDEEPAYRGIDGAWLADRPYVVVHRLAVADEMKGRGTATAFIRQIETLAQARGVHSFRIDTSFDNHYMLRMLSTLGFTFCGRICYESGERLAYEKLLDDETL